MTLDELGKEIDNLSVNIRELAVDHNELRKVVERRPSPQARLLFFAIYTSAMVLLGALLAGC